MPIKDDLNRLNDDWEKRVIERLNTEYSWHLRERKVRLKSVLITLVDSETFWARWCPDVRTIEFSRKLVREYPWHIVQAVLTHEIAHQYVDEVFATANGGPHGEAFRHACEVLGVPAEYRRASINLQTDSLDWRTEKRDDVSEKMLERVRKLLALATSANEHEAALAMNRVREIYAKYNLENIATTDFVRSVIPMGKRIEVFETKIMMILIDHFFVEVITGSDFDPLRNIRHRSVTLIGRRENVLMAEYVFHFLRDQSARITRTAEGLDRTDRRAYRIGILDGFVARLKEAEKPPSVAPLGSASMSQIGNALVAFKKDPALSDYVRSLYPRLTSSTSRSTYHLGSAYRAGHSAGRSITLQKPVSGRAGNLGRLLGAR